MTDPTNFRREQIEKLLHELRYEVERGMMEREIEEEMGFRFYVQVSDKIRGWRGVLRISNAAGPPVHGAFR